MSQSTRTVAAARGIARRWVHRNGATAYRATALRSNFGLCETGSGERPFFHTKRSFSEAAAAAQKSQDNPDVYELEDDSDDDDYDDDDYGVEDELPWKTLLELPARAGWRSSDPHPPEIVMKAQAGVLNAGGATLKQIRRTYVDIVASHKALAQRRERERRRLINSTFYSRRARQRDEETLPVIYGRIETLAFLRSRLRPNYAITKRVLEETQSLLHGWKPKRIIDMGIGVGCASAAALGVFDKDVEWIHGIDPSRCMRECSKSFLEEIMEEMAKDTRVNPPRLTLGGSIATEASSSTFDLAMMTYTAVELPDVSSTLAAAAILFQKLAPNGVFVLIEPGTPDGFNTIRAVRNMLLDCCPPDSTDDETGGDECHIIAPCTHNGKCPMERFQRNALKQKNPRTQMDYEPEGEFDEDHDDYDDSDDDDEEDSVEGEEAEDGWETMEFGRLDEAEFERSSIGHKDKSDMTDQTQRLGGRFCSFVQTMSSGSHLKKGEKFSYLVAQKRSPGEENDADNQSTFQNDRLRDLLANIYEANETVIGKDDAQGLQEHRLRVQNSFEEAKCLEARYLDSEESNLGLEFLAGDVNRGSFGRIIRAPLKKRGHVYIDYCSAPGRLTRSRVTKSFDYGVAPGVYTAARKSRWGGLWPDIAPLSHDNDDNDDDDEL